MKYLDTAYLPLKALRFVYAGLALLVFVAGFAAVARLAALAWEADMAGEADMAWKAAEYQRLTLPH